MSTAYLVISIMMENHTPVAKDAGIFSEPHPSCNLRSHSMVLHQVTHPEGYGAAEKELLHQVELASKAYYGRANIYQWALDRIT